jgi:hypothetical protein
MPQCTQVPRSRGFWTTAPLLLAIGLLPAKSGYALITGGEGHSPIADPGWPKGAAKIFNEPARVAWWAGPPLGGGQWHGEYRGNAQVFNSVLRQFVALDLKTKRVIVHDGIGRSFWLDPNHEPAKRAAAAIDWTFFVWQQSSWERVRKLPPSFRPPGLGDADTGPTAEIDVYVGGNVRWSEVVIPAEVKVVDERLQAHGFTAADGVVLEGEVRDLTTKKPLRAQLRLERIEAQPRSYRYTEVAQTVSDNQGHWVLKKLPAGWYRLVAEAEGFVPRVVGYDRLDGEPQWHRHDCGLTRAGSLSGRVTDEAGKPLADVLIQLPDVVTEGPGDAYRPPSDIAGKTDAEGRFHLDQAPVGKATLWLHKKGYLLPTSPRTLSIPGKDVVLRMGRSAQVSVTVDFGRKERPHDYVVEIEAEGGRAVGSWGGSGSIDQENQIVYAGVPPGRYVIQGRPNPYSPSRHEQTTPVTIELQAGQSAQITLRAR